MAPSDITVPKAIKQKVRAHNRQRAIDRGLLKKQSALSVIR
jgi:hypothetical protein